MGVGGTGIACGLGGSDFGAGLGGSGCTGLTGSGCGAGLGGTGCGAGLCGSGCTGLTGSGCGAGLGGTGCGAGLGGSGLGLAATGAASKPVGSKQTGHTLACASMLSPQIGHALFAGLAGAAGAAGAGASLLGEGCWGNSVPIWVPQYGQTLRWSSTNSAQIGHLFINLSLLRLLSCIIWERLLP